MYNAKKYLRSTMCRRRSNIIKTNENQHNLPFRYFPNTQKLENRQGLQPNLYCPTSLDLTRPGTLPKHDLSLFAYALTFLIGGFRVALIAPTQVIINMRFWFSPRGSGQLCQKAGPGSICICTYFSHRRLPSRFKSSHPSNN